MNSDVNIFNFPSETGSRYLQACYENIFDVPTSVLYTGPLGHIDLEVEIIGDGIVLFLADPRKYDADLLSALFLTEYKNFFSDMGFSLLVRWPTDKADGWRSLLSNREGLSEKRKGARSLQVATVPHGVATYFYNRYHIQGYARGEHRALTDGVDIYAIMTCQNGHACQGSSRDALLLRRFASRGSVAGAASKLLSSFRKSHLSIPIVSYSNLRYSDGDLYRKLGFEPVLDNKPSFIVYRNGIYINNRTAWPLQESDVCVYDLGKMKWELR